LVDVGALATAALRRREKAAQTEGHGSVLAFPVIDGKPMRRSNVRHRHFRPLCERAGITGLRLHDLRHSMTSLAIAAGSAVKVISERLGHSTTRLTQDRYAHELRGLQRQTASAIDSTLKAAKRSKRT
jgi:integrase